MTESDSGRPTCNWTCSATWLIGIVVGTLTFGVWSAFYVFKAHHEIAQTNQSMRTAYAEMKQANVAAWAELAETYKALCLSHPSSCTAINLRREFLSLQKRMAQLEADNALTNQQLLAAP